MGRRITRKQLKGDEFVSTVDTMIQWLTENWRPFAAGLGLLCAITLLWWGGSRWMSARDSRASGLLATALESYRGDDADAASEAGRADLEAAERQLGEVVERYGHSVQADVARVYLARIALDRGDADGARQSLLRVAERRRGTALGRLAELDLMHLRVESGQGAEVAKELEQIVVGKDDALPRDAALYELGRLYVEERQPERAREYLEKLVEEFPDSPYLSEARRQLDELG